MPTAADPIQLVDFSRAEDFLNELAPRTPVRRPERWVFRGHGDSKYILLPSARRDPMLHTRRFPIAHQSINAQFWSEAEVVRSFYRLCDRRGIMIPGDNPDIRDTFQPWHEPTIVLPPFMEGMRDWPSRQFLPIVAAAQHHGLPTCLLDWTYRPYVAAFFAAHDNVKARRDGKSVPDYFSVWAFDLIAFKMQRIANNGQKPDAPEHIEERIIPTPGPFHIVTVPSATIARVRAQSGLFLLHRPDTLDPLPFTPWDSLLSEIAVKAMNSEPYAPRALRHLRVEASQAEAVLRCLEREEVTWSNLFPGMAGVADELKTEMNL